jgi:hypothetical protein
MTHRTYSFGLTALVFAAELGALGIALYALLAWLAILNGGVP